MHEQMSWRQRKEEDHRQNDFIGDAVVLDVLEHDRLLVRAVCRDCNRVGRSSSLISECVYIGRTLFSRCDPARSEITKYYFLHRSKASSARSRSPLLAGNQWIRWYGVVNSRNPGAKKHLIDH